MFYSDLGKAVLANQLLLSSSKSCRSAREGLNSRTDLSHTPHKTWACIEPLQACDTVLLCRASYTILVSARQVQASERAGGKASSLHHLRKLARTNQHSGATRNALATAICNKQGARIRITDQSWFACFPCRLWTRSLRRTRTHHARMCCAEQLLW